MNRAIKVLHTEWSDGWGGQEIRIINEMIAMREKGVEVFLACRDHATIKQKALENNIKVFALPFRGNADLKTLFSLRKIISNYAIDIVNTHSGKDTWVGGLAAKLAGVKFIRTRHLSNRIRSSRTNFINELADYIITTGESVRSDMIKYNRISPENIQSIPTGIDSKLFNPKKYDSGKCRRQFNIEDDEIVIGIVAVLRQFKRHDLFLKMTKKLINRHPNRKFKFLIAGDGPKKDSIRQLIDELEIAQHVELLGHVSNVPEFLSALDIFVLSSDSKEGVPQSVMQALFMNKSVVATDSGSTRDLLLQENFQIVSVGSVEALLNGVENYIDSDKEIMVRDTLIRNFDKNSMTKKILEIYNLLLNPV